jgi:ribosome biogenesis GTPase
LLRDVADDAEAGRVVRHDGAGLLVATDSGIRRVMFTSRLDPEPTVGDWIALIGDAPVAVLPRTSLLRRRTAHGEDEQALAANVDVVLLVCGLDRPVRGGRLQRGSTLAWDAGAEPVVVLTKAARVAPDVIEEAVGTVTDATPGLDVVVTSVKEGRGLDELHAVVRDRTVVMLGESGAGKSSIVNALLGSDAAAIGDVRAGDAKGRHTTTSRQLHPLDGGGVLVDTPGIRAVGLWVDPDAVDAAFTEVDEVAELCRFADCSHGGEPGCQLAAALEAGELDPARVDAWKALRREAESAALRAVPHEQRRRDKRFSRIVKDAQRRKGRDEPR